MKEATMIEGKLFALLRLGMGMESDEDHSLCIVADEWPSLYRLASEQAVLGIALEGATRLRRESYPPRSILLPWVAQVEQVKRRNRQMDALCGEVERMLASVGIGCRILKGQGVARMYPKPELRQSGDIDAWVRIDGWQGSTDESIREIDRRICSLNIGEADEIVYHHLHWHLTDVEVEVHYRPQTLNNPFANRRFQRWYREQWDEYEEHCVTAFSSQDDQRKEQWNDNENKIETSFTTPSADFNAVYLLAHLFHHLLFDGVGLRQLCDYLALLQSADLSETSKDKTMQVISKFGMTRFAGGVMWLLQEVFHISRDKLLMNPNEKEGKLILAEMLRAGNFGHNLTPRTSNESTLHRFTRLTSYRLKYLLRYPMEIIWDIPFRLYHFVWRHIYG